MIYGRPHYWEFSFFNNGKEKFLLAQHKDNEDLKYYNVKGEIIKSESVRND